MKNFVEQNEKNVFFFVFNLGFIILLRCLFRSEQQNKHTILF